VFEGDLSGINVLAGPDVDCSGECGGTAIVDDCFVCDGGNADDLGCGCFENGPSGCDNTCGSTLEDDECGVCGGDGPEDNFDCDGNCLVDIDCISQCGGTAFIDECGDCVGGNTGSEACSSVQTVEIALHNGANLISLYALPDNNSVGNIMSSLEGIATELLSGSAYRLIKFAPL
jgi:hypothetical protein